MGTAITTLGVITVILFLLLLLVSRSIGEQPKESKAWEWLYYFESLGLILAGVWAIIVGIRQGEFNYRFESGVLIAFLISLLAFLALLFIEFING